MLLHDENGKIENIMLVLITRFEFVWTSILNPLKLSNLLVSQKGRTTRTIYKSLPFSSICFFSSVVKEIVKKDRKVGYCRITL